MRRLAALVVLTLMGGADAARAECGGVLALCAEDTPIERPGAAAEDEYQRLDGGGFGGRPEASKPRQFTIGDTTVTLGETPDNAPAWQNSAPPPGSGDSKFRPESNARSGNLDPLNQVCGADGCR
ncbi:MAG: hypothetical protein Q7V31_08440 [Parvibaculum sp.]|uniref:hypothetical protein n=1 Tax=Parvibaculum sp. TaxID=2024848 RepID=UPI00271EE93F|nr:hypothetical protein [Parvibaculum sp.]MDO8838946.1 hypothetical protein [Parvibaculum sp.]